MESEVLPHFIFSDNVLISDFSKDDNINSLPFDYYNYIKFNSLKTNYNARMTLMKTSSRTLFPISNYYNDNNLQEQLK